MNSYNAFFHETSEFSDKQFENAKKEKKAIQQIYNKFADDEILSYSSKNEFIIFDYDVEILSIGEASFSPDALKSYTRKYIPKIQKYTYKNNVLSSPEDINLNLNDTKIVPAYINSQYIGDLMQDQFFHITRQCFLINLAYNHFASANMANEEIKKIKNENSDKKILIRLNDCKLRLIKPVHKINQGLDAVISETNHFLKKIMEQDIIVVGSCKNYIDESPLIDQIIEDNINFNIGKELKEHFKNDMLLLNNKTILDDKDKGYTSDWISNFIFPPKLVSIEDGKCVLSESKKIKKMWEKINQNHSQLTFDLFSKPINNEENKLFFYNRIKTDDTFFKIEFVIPQNLLEDIYIDVIQIANKLLNESTTLNQ
ncbi:hypothetical protein FACS1894181_15370 [Bacteroidia bacterium]|nr:hypothetical protein FACS1894181_15370 [Bacteroidia bacterium]